MTVVLARLPRTLACLGLAAIATPLGVYGQGSSQVTGLIALAVALVLLFLPSLFTPAPPAPKTRRRSTLADYRAHYDLAWHDVAAQRAQRSGTGKRDRSSRYGR